MAQDAVKKGAPRGCLNNTNSSRSLLNLHKAIPNTASPSPAISQRIINHKYPAFQPAVEIQPPKEPVFPAHAQACTNFHDQAWCRWSQSRSLQNAHASLDLGASKLQAHPHRATSQLSALPFFDHIRSHHKQHQRVRFPKQKSLSSPKYQSQNYEPLFVASCTQS